MKAKIQCLIDWLGENRSDSQAWQILFALASETLKRADSADPAQREFDVLGIAQACHDGRDWDYESAKRWFSRAAVQTYLEARRSELDAYFRERGHDQSFAVTQRPSTGRYRAQWYLSPRDLESGDAGDGSAVGPNLSQTGCGSVEPDLVYEFTPPSAIKLSFVGRWLMGQGSFVTRSFRGSLWAALMMGSLLALLALLASLYLFWSMSRLQRPVTTGDLIGIMILVGGAWVFWLFLVRPWVRLLEDRIVPAGEVLIGWHEAPAYLDMTKDGKFRYVRLVRYGGVCPVCAGTICLLYTSDAADDG
ncbi:MAG: hypothetical protein IAE92_11820, partial [Burkholderiaceae bacterium]|nr:hypothetical protein [Burkholderiaceae bacterium]